MKSVMNVHPTSCSSDISEVKHEINYERSADNKAANYYAAMLLYS